MSKTRNRLSASANANTEKPGAHSTIPDVAWSAPASVVVDREASIIDQRYEVRELIGAGGMATVYRVTHAALGKEFALKRLHPELASHAAALDQFFREARIASSLSHPNIVSIVDFGEDKTFGAYMVMEFLRGESLSSRLAGGGLATRAACDIANQIAEALKYIHEHSIVHRDIKPENILLCQHLRESRRRNEVKLLDFGIARFRQTINDGVVSGTPEYMSPEQIRGEDPSVSMDIYALGILFFELLTGVQPFRGEVDEVLDAHLDTPPPSLSDILKQDVDEALEQIVSRALSKDPKERQKDVSGFLFELRAVMDMLGLRRKRGGRTNKSNKQQREIELMAQGFGYCLWPLALVDETGLCRVCNDAFAKFMGHSKREDVEGQTIATDRLLAVCPMFEEELAKTLGRNQQRACTVPLGDQDGKELRLTFSPTDEGLVVVGAQFG